MNSENKYRHIASIKEIGSKTDKIETTRFPEYISNNCNLTTCRYNKDGECTNEESRKECVEISRKVLCLDEKANCIVDKVILEDFVKKNKCEQCGHAIRVVLNHDSFLCGSNKCKHAKCDKKT